MSFYARIATLGLAVLLLLGTHWKAYVAGGDSVRLEWEQEKVALAIQQENLRLLRQASVNKVAKDFTEKTQKDKVVTITIIKEVDKYVSNGLPMLPGSFRVYHDAAAQGVTPGDPSGTDAPSVSPKDVAITITENYADCRYDQERLKALQEIIRNTLVKE